MAEYPGEVLQLVLVIIRDLHLDDSLRCRVKDSLAAADGLGLQAKPKLITFQPEVH